MINIKEYLSDSSLEVGYYGEITEHDIVVSSVITFSSIAKSDEKLETSEINTIIGIIVREFDIKETEATEIFQVALLLSEDKEKFTHFLEKIKDNFNFLQKQLLMALIWRVILSDKEIEKFEATMAVKIRTTIGLTMEEAVRSRKLAELDILNLQSVKNELGEC